MDNLIFDKAYQSQGFESQRRYPNEPLIQFLASHYFPIPNKKKIKILELGCGSGANLWMIAKEGFGAYGQDISEAGIELCRKMLDSYGVSAALTVGNFKKLKYPDNFFDAIVDVLSTEHTDLAGHYECYTEIYRCLKPQGRFFSWHLGSNSVNFKEGGGKLIDRLTIDNVPNPNVPYFNNGLTCFLTPEDAEKMLKSIGFRNVNVESFTKTYKGRSQLIEYLTINALK